MMFTLVEEYIFFPVCVQGSADQWWSQEVWNLSQWLVVMDVPTCQLQGSISNLPGHPL